LELGLGALEPFFSLKDQIMAAGAVLDSIGCHHSKKHLRGPAPKRSVSNVEWPRGGIMTIETNSEATIPRSTFLKISVMSNPQKKELEFERL
jgi:hypothetical protein